jgi:hypothetical protein
MRRGNIVTIPKEPKYREYVVIDVKYSDHGEAMVFLGGIRGHATLWTRASNVETIDDISILS